MLIASFVVAAALAAAAPTPAGSVIEVSDVEQLYDAVNEPANAGATIVLAPGRYVLTRVKPGDGARPNGGRLELQTDMSITGVSGHPEDVVIDSSDPLNGRPSRCRLVSATPARSASDAAGTAWNG